MQEAVKNLEKNLEGEILRLCAKPTTPLTIDYRAEVDQTSELDDEDATLF